MHANVASWTMAAVGAALIAGPGEALAPDAPRVAQFCVPDSAAVEAAAEAEAPPELAPLDRAQRALVAHLARRYYVAASEIERIVRVAYRAAEEAALDPLLVLAVISIESRFNPIAESGMGAKGLMQIIPKYHHAKLADFGGESAVLDPESNIVVGTRILREYVRRTGTLEAGLQFYNGALWDASGRYSQKVLAERLRLEAVVRGKGSA